MQKTGIDFKTFLRSYNHINYFECIMFPDGTLVEARPSHTYKLCEIYNSSMSIEEINNKIPIYDSPIIWLLSRTKCVALWYSSIEFDYRNTKLTKQQIRNIFYLDDNGYIQLNLKLKKIISLLSE